MMAVEGVSPDIYRLYAIMVRIARNRLTPETEKQEDDPVETVNIPATGLELKIARVRAGVKQYDLAAECGIPAPVLSMIESGRRHLPPDKMHSLATALDRIANRSHSAEASTTP